MKYILVTGGAGYIGSHIIEKLVKSKKKIIILDNLTTGYKYLINKKTIFFKGDIQNKSLLKKILSKFKVETIIHLAAYLNINEGEINKKKYYKNNVNGTLNLIKCCEKSYVKNFIFSSSCSVYGNCKGAVSEKNKVKPKSYYAYTKFRGEELIKKYAKKFKYKYAILRYFNVGGASKSNKIGEICISHNHLIKNISAQSLKKKPIIKIYGNKYLTNDGTCIRDYIHVSDLAELHIKILNFLQYKKKSIVINCGYGKGFSVLEIAKKAKKLIKNLKISYVKKRLGDVAEIYSNTNYLKKKIKWKPKYNIDNILKSSIKWEKKLHSLKLV